MGARLFLLFLTIPAIELALLLQLGRWIGLWPTIGLIFATAVAGSYLARREGLATWRAFQQRLASGQLPGRELVDGLLILLSGVLLITPGVLTDLLGLLGLLPPTRALIRRYLLRRLQQSFQRGKVYTISFGGFVSPDDAVWSGRARTRPRYLEDEGY